MTDENMSDEDKAQREKAVEASIKSVLYKKRMFASVVPGSHVRTGWVEITPAIAEVWLAMSGGNRAIRWSHVAEMAHDMRSGEWKSNDPQCIIIFTRSGLLRDGHHRLHAIVASKCTIGMKVEWGHEDEDLQGIDTAIPRTLGDQYRLHRSQVENRTALISTTRCVAELLTDTKSPVMRRLRRHDIWYATNKEGIDWAVSLVVGPRSLSITRSAPFSGALAFAYRGHPCEMREVGEKLRDGTGLRKDEPIWLARKMLERAESNPAKYRGYDRHVITRKLLRALHAQFIGEKLDALQDTPEGLYYFRTFYQDLPEVQAAIRVIVSLTTMPSKLETKAAVLAMLRKLDKRVRADTVYRAMQKNGDKATRNEVTWALGVLASEGYARRDKQGFVKAEES